MRSRRPAGERGSRASFDSPPAAACSFDRVPVTDALRLLHWNVHSWHDDQGESNAERVVELVHACRPDIVTLVEVDEGWRSESPLAHVASETGLASVFVPAFEYGRDGEPRGGFGNAILSRLPISAVLQRHPLWPPPTYEGNEPSEARTVLLVKVRAAGGVCVGATHLPRSDASCRAEAAKRLLAVLDSITEPWAVCGDFNMSPAQWLP